MAVFFLGGKGTEEEEGRERRRRNVEKGETWRKEEKCGGRK